MTLKWPDKDPDEVLDYLVDWTPRLNGDVITISEWTIPTDITKNSDNHTASSTTIWLSGGSLNKSYNFLNRIHTTGGRTMDQTIQLRVSAK